MTDKMTGSEPESADRRASGSRYSLLLPIAIPVGGLLVIGLVLIGFSGVLLSMSASAATGVALIVATSIMVFAAFVARRDRVSNGALFSMVGAVAGVAMFAGGLAIVVIGKGEEGGPPGVTPLEVTIAAPKGAAGSGFVETTLRMEAGRPTSLVFDNKDPGVPHSVQIFGEDPAKNPQATALFTGAIITGPAKTTYNVPALESGTYYYRCEVHPATMTGTIEVGGGPAGGASVSVTAQGIQFDTKEIDLPAGQPAKIVFDNKDAATPHNIAIYSDESKSTTLFQGEIVTGPTTTTYALPTLDAGTYYFQCDVHPAMNGAVVVSAGGGGASAGSPGPSGSATAALGASPSG